MKILIVDDIKESLDLLDNILTTYNFSTVRAMNGLDGLEQLASNDVELIISDVLMPKMDGFQFCREVKKHPQFKSIPFIFYTANYIDPEDEQFARSLGAEQYLIKPIDISVLVDAVNQATKSSGTEKREEQDSNRSAEESEYLKGYNAVLIKKLEDKMSELEQVNDILSQKNKELQISRERYRNLFESSSIATFLLEPSTWVVVDANRQAEKMFLTSRTEILGQRFLFFEPVLEQVLTKEMPVFYECEVSTLQSTEIFAEVSASRIDTSEHSVVMAFVRDVTEQRKLKEKLLQAERLALLGELSAGIAHEIRNPLAAININLQFLLRTLNADLQQERKVVETALVGVERIDGIVSATLNFAKPTRPVFKPHNINDIIRVTVPLAKVSMEKKNAKVSLDLEENLPMILVDFKQIQQVIVNLLSNAADAIRGKGEIVIKSQLAVMANDVPGVCVTVSDNGEGMSKDEVKKIFEPFFTKKASGTGLGLSVSQQILSFHKATIDVTSEQGKGTTFRFVFPAIIHKPEEKKSETSDIISR